MNEPNLNLPWNVVLERFCDAEPEAKPEAVVIHAFELQTMLENMPKVPVITPTDKNEAGIKGADLQKPI